MVTAGRRTRRRAFALVDAIVATVILGAALAVIVGLSGRAIASQARGEQLQIASMLLDEQLELLVAVGPEAYRGVFGERGVCPPPFETYRYEIDLDPSSGGEPTFVSATISWPHAGGERSITVDTLIAPRRGDDPDPDRAPEQRMERE